MSGWDTSQMAAALPADDVQKNEQARIEAAPAVTEDLVHKHGWTAKTAYDYEQYTKTNKELIDDAAAGGVAMGEWASNAGRYEWKDDYGDVGPRFEELEKMLFGSEFHVRSGINFERITEINVTQEGPIRLEPARSFDNAGLHPVMLENIKLAGYVKPTPVQAFAMPAILKGHDLIACAQTGSGKTAAFLIPTISKLMGKAKKICAPRPNPAMMADGEFVRAEPVILVVCPSRELATQIFDEARRFCYRSMFRPCVIYGGGPRMEQVEQLRKGCDVLIGTPGRLCDFIASPHILTLKRLKYIIIDEADEMLNSDWSEELQKIMSGGDQEEGNINYMMFSATFPKGARSLAKEHLAHDHVRIRVGRAGSSSDNITQNVVFVEPSLKRKALIDLLLSTPPSRTLIFVNSKRTADEVDDFLYNTGFPCTSIHSDRTQREREDAIRAFRTGKAPIMIATGVSARGLDIRNVMHIINYDLPSNQYGGIDEYIHRIGRTGRIGNKGLANSFYNGRDEELGEKLTKILLETQQDVPDFLEQYIPEGYVAGNGVTKLDFEDESDDEKEGSDDGAVAAGTGWGATDTIAAAPVEAAAAPAAGGGWGAVPATSAPMGDAPAPGAGAGGWGAASVQAPATSGWDAAAPAAASAGWESSW